MDIFESGGAFGDDDALGDDPAFDSTDADLGDALHRGGLADDGAARPVGEIGDGSSGGPDALDNLWVHDDGRVWDLGPADLDTDADGRPDSIARPGPDGLTVYTDVDHDGQVDKISEVRSDGTYETRTLDPENGTWVSTDSGRLS